MHARLSAPGSFPVSVPALGRVADRRTAWKKAGRIAWRFQGSQGRSEHRGEAENRSGVRAAWRA